MEWRTDILGDEFQACVFEAKGNDGTLRTATLVRHAPFAGQEYKTSVRLTAKAVRTARRAVLFLHGWSDYFFNVELARFWAGHGFDFFALDMHNHGRSLQPDLPGGYVSNLEDYDAEIGRAIEII